MIRQRVRDYPQAVALQHAEEAARIRADTNLTAELRAVELKKAELEQLKAVAEAVGQEFLAEPQMPPKPPPAIAHVLKPGEGLSFLSQYYGVTPNDLRAANPDINFDKPKAGVSIRVPLSLLPPGRVLPPQ